jgi:hypothetical protein
LIIPANYVRKSNPDGDFDFLDPIAENPTEEDKDQD